MTEGTRITVSVVRGNKTTDYDFEWRKFGSGGKWWHYDTKKEKWVASSDRLQKKATARALELSEIGAEPAPSPKPVQLELPLAPKPDTMTREETIALLREMFDERFAANVAATVQEVKAVPGDDDITEETIVKEELYDADFFGPRRNDALILHRVKVPGHGRLYAVKYRDADLNWGRTEFYTGVTSVCDAVLGYDDGLVEWAVDNFNSYDEMRAYVEEMADYGSFAHGGAAKCAKGELPKDFDSSEWNEYVRHWIAYYGYDVRDKFHDWNNRFRKFILSFKNWVYERNVVFHAIEIPLGIRHSRGPNGDKVFGYYAQLDFVVTMDAEKYPDDPKREKAKMPEKPKNGRVPHKEIAKGAPFVFVRPASSLKWEPLTDDDHHCNPPHRPSAEGDGWCAGEPIDMIYGKFLDYPQVYVPYPNPVESIVRKRITAIVDLKTGKNSYPSHALQLQLQVPLLKANFPNRDWTGIRLFNLHTSDWQERKDNPTFGYSLREKTWELQKGAPKYLEIWQVEHARELPRKVIYVGSPNLDTHPNTNTKLVDYVDYFDEKFVHALNNEFIKI